VNFSGRASRSEYWYWVLFTTLAEIVTSIVGYGIGYQVTTSVFGLAVLLPGLAVVIRRLHDFDRSGWWILLLFVPVAFVMFHRPAQRDDDRVYIPLISAIVLIVWYCTKGTEGPNRFGPDRLVMLAGAHA
jgi:uncharacterized membrane protein YhaH (DUF805 family)